MIKLITFAAAAAAALSACSSDRPITDPAASLSPSFSTSASASVPNSGFYANRIIVYQATAQVTASPQAAQQLSAGNIVFHIVDPSGNVPAVQLARLTAALPDVGTAGNVLNFIPPPQELGGGKPGEIELGYTGGAWNLQIFHWNAGATVVELSSDTDIFAAVAAGTGTLEVTNILVRCPVINFANLR